VRTQGGVVVLLVAVCTNVSASVYAVRTQGGVVVLLVAVCTNVAYNTASKSLSLDIGGAKRLHALSSVMSSCLLLPWTVFIFFTRQVSIVSHRHYS